MATTHEYSGVIWLHMLIDYQNISTVNFLRGQKVVPAGWLVSADGLEISLYDPTFNYVWPQQVNSSRILAELFTLPIMNNFIV